jgi:hypothetical protein
MNVRPTTDATTRMTIKKMCIFGLRFRQLTARSGHAQTFFHYCSAAEPHPKPSTGGSNAFNLRPRCGCINGLRSLSLAIYCPPAVRLRCRLLREKKGLP